MDEAAPFELTEVAVEADLAAEEMAEIGFKGLAFHRDFQVGGAHRRLLIRSRLHRPATFLLSLALGKNQQAPENRQERHAPP